MRLVPGVTLREYDVEKTVAPIKNVKIKCGPFNRDYRIKFKDQRILDRKRINLNCLKLMSWKRLFQTLSLFRGLKWVLRGIPGDLLFRVMHETLLLPFTSNY